jgi:hypothetical protein
MNLTRTTLRINTNLKQAAEKQALQENRTLQSIFNDALEQYLVTDSKKKASKIVFKTHDLGMPLDNLTRSDYYSSP